MNNQLQDKSLRDNLRASDSQAFNVHADDGYAPFHSFRDESSTLFSRAMAQSRMAVVLSDAQDPDLPVVFANQAFLDLTGYEEREILGRNCRFLQGPETDQNCIRQMRNALENEDVIVVELLNYKKNGEPFWSALHLGPLYDEHGVLQYFCGSQWDVTEVHSARAGEQHAKLLTRELSHRVKNMFAIISAVVTMTSERYDDDGLAQEINERILALGRAYDVTLRQSPAGPVPLEPLMRTVLLPYSVGDGQKIGIQSHDIMIMASQSATIGLILHELATNAVKYGAMRSATGSISIKCDIDGAGTEPILRIEWAERSPQKIEAPSPTGAGMGIMDRILEASDGTIDRQWEPDGLTATIFLPLE